MNICFVVSSLQGGGAERVISLLANGLSSKGNCVSIICLTRHKIFYDISEKVNIIFLSEPKKSMNIIQGCARNLIKIYKLARSLYLMETSVTVSFITQINLIAIFANLFVRKPLIISERANPRQDPIRNVLKMLRKLVYRFSSALVVQSSFAEKYFTDFGVPLYKILNPVAMTPSLSTSHSRMEVVLGVGRLSHEKGFDQLIKAFAKANIPNWQLWIVGDGYDRQELEQLSQDLGIDKNVTFWGMQKNISYFYEKAGIFVLPSRHEGFPNALCEAMVAGMPVVAYDCDAGPSELIANNCNGILIKPGQIALLANAIKHLADNKDLRDALASRASDLVNQLSADKIIDTWKLLIDQVAIKE